jgi:hypothetical protein
MSVIPKAVSASREPGNTIADPSWRFQSAIHLADVIANARRSRVIAIYRARTRECVEKARAARQTGLIAAACGFLDEAETWTQFADAWALRLANPEKPSPVTEA